MTKLTKKDDGAERGMRLAELHIHYLRNISFAKLHLHPRNTIFFGPNGSGKTSLLEAIYLLGTGHSFRTREITPLIATGHDKLTIFTRTATEESISIQKSAAHPTQVKLNKQPCYSSSELARFLPCQIFYQDIFHIMDAGASIRRNLIDWGLFHSQPTYLSVWKEYRRVLKQRNALLRQRGTAQQCAPWDNQLVSLALQLDSMRAAYFTAWEQVFQTILAQLTDVTCTIEYYKGWNKKNTNKDLATILQEQFASDSLRQYTQSGAHHADIIFDTTPLKAKYSLSRGQQKIILIALKLAQSRLLAKSCIYLFDDLHAELDSNHLQRLMNCLTQLPGQFVFTANNPQQLITHFPATPGFTIYALNNGKVSETCFSAEGNIF